MYNTLVTFKKPGETRLNRQTGNRDNVTEEETVEQFVHRSHTSASRQELLYGAIRRHAYTLRFQGDLDVSEYNQVIIEGDPYQIDDWRTYELDTVLWVSSNGTTHR